MTTSSQLTGASAPLVLQDGTEWQMSPLSDRDISELDNWLRSHYLRTVRNSFDDLMSQEDKDNANAIAFREAASLTWLSGTGASLLSTVDGMSRLVWQMGKKRHPDLTPEQVREKMFSPEAINRAMEVFEFLNMTSEEDKNKDKDKPPKKGARRKRRPH